ncbi:hypothetical protein [Azospirillum aestuarii]|uniref:hypothetical protein n=1 Tax=Azospirillum aestuarii TaxID=2802052 RepID=UPI00405505B7
MKPSPRATPAPWCAGPPNSQRTIDEVLTRIEGGLPVVALDFTNVPASARRDLVEALGRYANDNKVDEFEWAMLPDDARRVVAEILGTYRNGIQVDQLTFADVPADTQRDVAELLKRSLNGETVANWTPIVLPGNASRTVSETVKRDVSETVTSAAMRDLTSGYQTIQLQTTSVLINQLHTLGTIITNGTVNVVRAITGNWSWGSNLNAEPAPHVLTTREAEYLARYKDLADAWVSWTAWDPTNHYNTDGWREGRTFAVGGRVHGPGTDTSDDVAAWLSRDEYVLRAQAARSAGYDALEALNEGRVAEAARMLAVRANDNAPRFARGGRVGSISAGAATISAAGAATPWDSGATAAIARLTGEVQRLTGEVVTLRRERAEDAGRQRRLMEGIGADQIGVAERQEAYLKRIGGRRRPVL